MFHSVWDKGSRPRHIKGEFVSFQLELIVWHDWIASNSPVHHTIWDKEEFHVWTYGFHIKFFWILFFRLDFWQ